MRMAQAAAGLSPDAMPSMMVSPAARPITLFDGRQLLPKKTGRRAPTRASGCVQGGGGYPSPTAAGTPLAAAQQLKAEGNRLHTARQYGAAAEKYEQARQRIQGEAPIENRIRVPCGELTIRHGWNLLEGRPADAVYRTPRSKALSDVTLAPPTVELRRKLSLRLWSAVVGDDSPTATELRKACQLNLASCYLNTGRTQTVVQLCTDVLAAEPGNRKVLQLPCYSAAEHCSRDGK